MAPTIHRQRSLARLADPTLPRRVHRENNNVTDRFINSKRDKERMRRSAFRSVITESAAERRRYAGVSKSSSLPTSSSKTGKIRRPSKKLTSLSALADALPDVEDEISEETSLGKKKRQSHRESIRSRPGALKRKEKLLRAEIARFGVNLAELTATKEDEKVAVPSQNHDSMEEVEEATDGQDKTGDNAVPVPAPTARPSTANRFALLRNFISSNMEHNPAFAKQQ